LIITHFCFALDASKGGVPAGVFNITTQLSKYGIKSQIISTGNTFSQLVKNSHIIADLTVNGVEFVHSVSSFENTYGIGGFRDLKQKLANMPKPDLVVLHQVYSVSTIIGYFYARKFGIPYALQPHGSLTKYHESDNRIVKAIAKKLIITKILRGSNFIIVTSSNEKNDLVASLQSKSWILPYGAVSQSQGIYFAQPDQDSSDNIRIIFCGRFDKKKNLPLLIKSLPQVLRIYPNLTLDIAGSGTRKEVEKMIQLTSSLKVESKVVFHGWLEAGKLKNLLGASRLLVLPSENENFAIVVSEALSLGIPCVVSRFVGTSDIVAKHKAGVIIEQITPPSIADGIIRVLNGDRAIYMRAAFDATREDLNWSNIAMQWKAMVNSLA
jgi:glycosyltransferase involved in cell wall biosynthesis